MNWWNCRSEFSFNIKDISLWAHKRSVVVKRLCQKLYLFRRRKNTQAWRRRPHSCKLKLLVMDKCKNIDVYTCMQFRGDKLYHNATTDQVVWSGRCGAQADAGSETQTSPQAMSKTCLSFCTATTQFLRSQKLKLWTQYCKPEDWIVVGNPEKPIAPFWINVFQTLQDDGHFSGDFLDRSLIQYCFLNLVQTGLQTHFLGFTVLLSFLHMHRFWSEHIKERLTGKGGDNTFFLSS